MADHSHSHCHDEHSHDHGGGAHDHSDDVTPAIQSSLYKHIDFDKITTLNEATPGSGRNVVRKSWEDRLASTPIVESDADEELLMFIPFTGLVKLHSILIGADPGVSAPKTLKLFSNRDDMDFSSASDTQAVQTLDLPVPPPGNDRVMEIPVKRALFNNTRSLTLFFENNHSDGEDITQITYLGFKGDWTELKKEHVVTLYEAAANPADHKNLVPGAKYGSLGLGGRQGDGF
ncbi:galactose-binding domain-like protein [Tuber borchii]|uniref:Galactose-binding domain-like protein n=1 Tax=Tuber borchii TaxID=42251 RepID=A0A2T6ZW82_TUBBO|nr:galactose-binding domain-like protein [Tuber borchii]